MRYYVKYYNYSYLQAANIMMRIINVIREPNKILNTAFLRIRGYIRG